MGLEDGVLFCAILSDARCAWKDAKLSFYGWVAALCGWQRSRLLMMVMAPMMPVPASMVPAMKTVPMAQASELTNGPAGGLLLVFFNDRVLDRTSGDSRLGHAWHQCGQDH